MAFQIIVLMMKNWMAFCLDLDYRLSWWANKVSSPRIDIGEVISRTHEIEIKGGEEDGWVSFTDETGNTGTFLLRIMY